MPKANGFIPINGQNGKSNGHVKQNLEVALENE
jgi:hypothetical protein